MSHTHRVDYLRFMCNVDIIARPGLGLEQKLCVMMFSVYDNNIELYLTCYNS